MILILIGYGLALPGNEARMSKSQQSLQDSIDLSEYDHEDEFVGFYGMSEDDIYE